MLTVTARISRLIRRTASADSSREPRRHDDECDHEIVTASAGVEAGCLGTMNAEGLGGNLLDHKDEFSPWESEPPRPFRSRRCRGNCSRTLRNGHRQRGVEGRMPGMPQMNVGHKEKFRWD